MSPKQLSAVRHLLSEEQLHELSLASRLPRVNQGRKRHENRVAQLIRDGTSDAAVLKLAVRRRFFFGGGAGVLGASALLLHFPGLCFAGCMLLKEGEVVTVFPSIHQRKKANLEGFHSVLLLLRACAVLNPMHPFNSTPCTSFTTRACMHASIGGGAASRGQRDPVCGRRRRVTSGRLD